MSWAELGLEGRDSMTLRRILVLTLACIAVLMAALVASLYAKPSAQAQTLEANELPTSPVTDQNVSETGTDTSPTHEETPTPTPTPTATPTPTPTVEPPVWVQLELPEPEAVPNQGRAALPTLSTIESVPRDNSHVYLTFDDGPHPVYTNQILDLLAKYNAKATFFVLGRSVDAYPQIAARIVQEGHAIANHTYEHVALPNQNPEQIAEALGATSAAMSRATGRTSSCLRPPYGALDQPSYDAVRSLGYSVIMWEVDSNDWRGGDPYTIASTVLSKTRLGSRILFHDGPANRANTVAALESVLSVLSEKGVTFAALGC